MAESYPYQQSRDVPAEADPQLQRLLARVRQDEIQLAADQRQLRQQRVALEQLRKGLDTRQLELDASLKSVQEQQEALSRQRLSIDQEMAEGRARLDAREQALTRKAQELSASEKDAQARSAQLETGWQELRDRQRQLQAKADDLHARQGEQEARRQELQGLADSLQVQHQTLDARQASLERRETDLQGREDGLMRRQRQTQDVAGAHEQLERQHAERLQALEQRRRDFDARVRQREKDLQRQQAELAGQQAALHREQADLREHQAAAQALQESLARQQADLDRQADQLRRRQRQLDEQMEALEVRGQSSPAQQTVADGEDLALRCRQLQIQVDELVAAQNNGPVDDPSDPLHPAPTGDLAALATQAAQVRRRMRARLQGFDERPRARMVAAAGVALLAGVLIGSALFYAQSSRYRLEARIVLDAGSPSADQAVLAQMGHDLGGRLLEARLPGVVFAADRSPVTVDVRSNALAVGVLTDSAGASQAALHAVLQQYCADLEGGMRDGARARRDRDLAERIAADEAQVAELAAARQALLSQAEKLQPQAEGYQKSLEAVEQARRQLEEANRRNEDVNARLRVLSRTPPGARVELSPERIAAAYDADVSLAEVRRQVAARADELRSLLAELLTNAANKCDQLDAQVGGFLTFLAEQRERMSEAQLRDEAEGIAGQAARLKGVAQRCRRQIDELSGVLARSQDVARAGALAAVQAGSEKALESLTIEAADQIKQVGALLEKLPAGGIDVTRRTVLQERLRSRFAEVQKSQHEMGEIFNSLRPALNFRLDAALTAVGGLARRLQERQHVVLEQVQQQEAQARRQDYDRQVQQARLQQEQGNITRDRLLSTLTEATQQMVEADAGRARLIEVRARIDDLDRRAAALQTALEAARQQQAGFEGAASQPAVRPLEPPRVLEPPVNQTRRIGIAVAGGLAVWLTGWGGLMALGRRSAKRSSPAMRESSLASAGD